MKNVNEKNSGSEGSHLTMFFLTGVAAMTAINTMQRRDLPLQCVYMI